MPDKRSFSLITRTHKYYCTGIFLSAEQKEKVVEEKSKGEASALEKKEGRKGKAKTVSFTESSVVVSPHKKGEKWRRLHQVQRKKRSMFPNGT